MENQTPGHLTKPARTLICCPPPNIEEIELEDFTAHAFRVRKSDRRIGGCWELSWFFPLTDKDIGHRLKSVHKRGRQRASAYLQNNWFKNRLFYTILVKVGGATVWRGVVWEMELSLNGIKKRRSLDEVFNAYKAFYVDADDVIQETAWITNDSSIRRYGRREMILDLEENDEPGAEAECQSELAKTSEAWEVPTGIGRNLPEGLTITAVGLVYTTNNKYASAGDGSTDDTSTYVQELIGTDCDFVRPGRITENTLQSKKSPGIRKRAFDVLLSLMKRGDGTNPWKLWVDGSGFMHYAPENNAALYEWHGIEEGLKTLTGSSSPWAMQPGVLRDRTSPDSLPIPGSFLLQGNDSWIDEVVMSDGAEEPAFNPEQLDGEEVAQAQQEYVRWLEQEEQQANQVEETG